MNVSLDSESENLVKKKIEEGCYGSPDEMVSEGLRLLDLRDKKLADLRKEIKKGLDSGPSELLDIDDVISRGYQRLGLEPEHE